ncbi:hypothetical protein PSR33_09795 (plasmid) [Latilactobacillus curvatus]|uniref:Uncharacterized protein n=1 Tax=Latilactobacillus curvatus TaxID=28038 RepID=A0AAJ5RH23_LATCU|nr:hypothetical protein [Latilactobacillus curvatus]WDC92842.1 hypothetical protein PSR33_09795 [Latilactobacillus curvatus]
MIVEYMKSMSELKSIFPVGSIHENTEGEKYKVVRVIEPMPATNMASFPRVEFELIKIKKPR